MKEPNKPNPEDCCNSGCNPCIFDVYEQQLKLYQLYKDNGQNPGDISENAISQVEYTKFIVIENTDLDNDHNLILFVIDGVKNNKRVVWDPGNHFLVKYNTEELSNTKAYTPIKLCNKNCDFGVIVKRYKFGVVSNYLCNLKIGDYTMWRGPYGNFNIPKPTYVIRIIMIAQGTGLVPFYSIIKHILDNDDDFTKLTLIYCCKNIKSILFRNEIYSLKSFWNFFYEIYIGENSEDCIKYEEPINKRRLTAEDILKLKPYNPSDMFLICGSSTFIKEYTNILLKENVESTRIITF